MNEYDDLGCREPELLGRRYFRKRGRMFSEPWLLRWLDWAACRSRPPDAVQAIPK